MKKWIAILLSLTLLLGTAACGSQKSAPAPEKTEATAATEAPAPAETETPVSGEDAGLPTVGETVEGFTVKEVRDFPVAGGTAVLFEHDATGAELMYIANSDTDRVFYLTFFTRAIDNTGLPHVFEHSTLSGSEKYPSTALWFNLTNQTYNTFMNAFTYPLMTCYPVASLSEEQLLRYADFYTDSCLHPSVLEDESIYRTEAWRYRLADMDDDLTIEGTVYSEMQAAMSLDAVAQLNMLRTAFPGSTIGNESGGDPAYIPDMTWDALKEYHARYYHPSNCIAFLYGQFEDYTAFLRLLDQAFAPYEKQEFTFEDTDYRPLTESAEGSFSFPVEAGSGTDNRTTVYYALVCPGLKKDLDEEAVLNTLTDLLAADASPLMQELKKALPAGSFATYIETEGPEDAIVFVAENVNPEDAETFRGTVDKVLSDVADHGFDQELVDGVAASLSLSTRLLREGDNVGVNLINEIAYAYAASGDAFNYLDYVDALERLDDWNSRGVYADAVSRWLVGNDTTVLTSTYPQPGLREELDAAEAERLAEVKAAMSEDELNAIIQASNAQHETEDASEYVSQLQAVTVSSLPEEISEYVLTDETGDDGVRRLTARAGVDGVGQTLMLLDAAGLSQEDIHWFALYTALVGEMDTEEHTKEELASLTTRYLYNGQIRLSLAEKYGTDEFRPYLRAGWTAAEEDLARGYELMYELLFQTKFDDTETLLGLIQRNRASLKSAITATPYTALLYRALGAELPLYAYYDYFNYLPYYAFLEDAEQTMEQDPQAVVARLEAVQTYFHNRTNAVTVYAGSQEGIDINAPLADAFLARLDARAVEPAEYAFDRPADREALTVDSSVQYNAVVGDFAAFGTEEYTADLDALSALVSDAFLVPLLRDQYGVYTPLHGFISDAGVYLLSYRDPNVQETFDVYESLGGLLADLDLDQETLDGYILSAYSAYAAPDGELSGAVNAVLGRFSGEPEDLQLQYMRQLKALTPEKVKEYAACYDRLMENGLRFTVGGAGAVNANAQLFDAIFNPFGSVDVSQLELADVTEDYAHYEAVQFVLENMLMAPVSDTAFGVDENASVGELAAMLSALIGGDPSDPEGAVDTFIGYGILDEGTAADDALTGDQAQGILDTFSLAAQVDSVTVVNGNEPLTRGQLAQVFVDYYDALPQE